MMICISIIKKYLINFSYAITYLMCMVCISKKAFEVFELSPHYWPSD